jgi:integrase
MVPYIYSIDEIKRLLRAADERLEEDCLIRPKTFRTLLLLLYGSGLRISEALALNVGDVDLEERVLTIRETKFYKSRLVPIGDDLHGLLLRYGEHQHPAKSSGDRPFLADRHGNRNARGPNWYSSASANTSVCGVRRSLSSTPDCMTSATPSR